jgi:hypothetical protein
MFSAETEFLLIPHLVAASDADVAVVAGVALLGADASVAGALAVAGANQIWNRRDCILTKHIGRLFTGVYLQLH